MDAPQTPSSTAASSCATCHKLRADLPQPLKHCAKCKTASYCSQECQKQDWKNHKRLCSTQSSSNQSSTSQQQQQQSTGAHNPGFQTMNQMFGQKLLEKIHALPEKEAYAHLIDCFRMRVEDEYAFAGENIGIYGGEDPRPPFREFLDLAESRPGLLPRWWNAEKRRDCERMAVDASQWSDINCAVEKPDIQEHYKDSTAPMMLRVLGEKIYGRGFM